MTRKSLRCLRSTTTGFLTRNADDMANLGKAKAPERRYYSQNPHPISHKPLAPVMNQGARKTRASLYGLDLLLSVVAARVVHDMVCDMVNH
jgi:hypothetical protein